MSDAKAPVQTSPPTSYQAARAWLLRLMATPITAGVIALLLVAAGLIFTLQVEGIDKADKLQQIKVQASILASGIAAPLAFDDRAALAEYLNALRADRQIIAVGAYDASGRFIAGYNVAPATLPPRGALAPPVVTSRDLIVTAQVMQGNTNLGTVYLHATIDSLPRRAMRYIGIAAILVMASLLVAALGASYATLRDAHAELKDEIASRQQAEDALRQAQKMEALGQLTGGVAHDFNNLLMAASGSLDLMEFTTDPTKLEKLRSGMRHAIDRGAKLTQQLLTFARRSPLKNEVIDLAKRVRGMDALLGRLVTDSVTLEIKVPQDLWYVEADPSELEVAILNVAINARDAMPDGGVISIGAENLPAAPGRQEHVRLWVADSGTGIPADMLEKIFEPFFTTKGVGRGTGLGLSQVYGFARASGGDVLVDSKVGRGTTVSILLPRSLLTPKGANTGRPPIVTARESRRILLVEDDDIVAEALGELLAEIGYEHERAANGDEGLARLETSADFDLVLSDMIMPGKLSGLDLVRHIAQTWPHLPAILMTGYSAAAAAAVNEGIRLVAKPFTIQTLSAHIDAALAGDEPERSDTV